MVASTLRRRFSSAALLLSGILIALSASPAQASLAISTVPVGNAGNAGDVQPQGTFGAVAYDYRIGTYEVTNDQYAAFLNAVAATDTFNLYMTNMDGDPRGGIVQSGVSGSFSYAVKPNMGNKPVNLVNWFDALRFANWMHNGQPTGLQTAATTEGGAYTFTGATTVGGRNPGATWFLPTENEAYKAAFYDPTTASYFDYATSSNTAPTIATADANGNISNPGVNVANYAFGADWNAENGNVTTVGSAGPGSASPYGTYDQNGNVSEMTETFLTTSPPSIVSRQASFVHPSANLLASTRLGNSPNSHFNNVGFRVATIAAVPEATSVAFGVIAVMLAAGASRLSSVRRAES